MEIKNCEQYVLMQLAEQQGENDLLSAQNEKLRREVAELRAEKERHRAIFEAGRREVYRKATGYAGVRDGDGNPVPFEAWREENIYRGSIPSDVTLLGFIDEFDAELRADYEERLAEDE